MYRNIALCGWLLVVLVSVSLTACAGGQSLPPLTGTDILARGQHATWRDLAMAATAKLDLGGAWGVHLATITGQGQLTRMPHRVAWHFTSAEVGPNPEADVFTDEQGITSMKTADRPTWSTHDDSPSGFLNRGDFLRFELVAEVHLVGVETIAGSPTWHLTGVPPLEALAPLDLHGRISIREDLWLRQQDAYPLKIQLTGHGDTSTPNGQGQEIIAHQSTVITLLFSQWDTGLTLIRPL